MSKVTMDLAFLCAPFFIGYNQLQIHQKHGDVSELVYGATLRRLT